MLSQCGSRWRISQGGRSGLQDDRIPCRDDRREDTETTVTRGTTRGVWDGVTVDGELSRVLGGGDVETDGHRGFGVLRHQPVPEVRHLLWEGDDGGFGWEDFLDHRSLHGIGRVPGLGRRRVGVIGDEDPGFGWSGWNGVFGRGGHGLVILGGCVDASGESKRTRVVAGLE